MSMTLVHTGADLRAADAVRRCARQVLDAEPAVSVDYLVLVDTATLTDVPEARIGPALLAVAERVGTTRLIDNLPILLGAP